MLTLCNLSAYAAGLPSLRWQGKLMKLPLISASVVLYIVLAAAWICYSELVAIY